MPVLLNEVHALIADRGRASRFASSDSGARTLKRLDVNLLVGRPINRPFFPEEIQQEALIRNLAAFARFLSQ